jgi:hypothetical protein
MSLIDRIRAHYRAPGVLKLEVEEWGEGGKPVVVYYNPINLEERQKFRAAADRDGDVLAYVEVLVLKALDEKGGKLFTIEDKRWLRKEADPDVIRRIGLRMMMVPSVEDQEKNSSRTPT